MNPNKQFMTKEQILEPFIKDGRDTDVRYTRIVEPLDALEAMQIYADQQKTK